MKTPEIWIVDDDASIRWVLQRAIRQAGYGVRTFESAQSVPGLLERERPALIATDIRMPGLSGLQLLDAIRDTAPQVPVIVMTAFTDLDSALASYRGGAFEYLPKPFDVDEAVALVRRALEQRGDPPAGDPEESDPDAGIIGEAYAMQEVFRAIGRLANSQVNVLICGESGTGKELVARALHRHSPRSSRPFVAINTAAIPAELLESELFGHERGAFTGALTQRKGRFEQADGGTLFLDEIGDMPPALQTRLLRVLSDGRFYRVGGTSEITANVRILAATNQDLEAAVRDGRFREDLFHRLNVIRIRIPALRERREDIARLVAHFLSSAAREIETDRKDIHPDALRRLENYDWPGNVRQLENTCRLLTVMAPGQVITVDDLPEEILPRPNTGADWESRLRQAVDQQLASGAQDLLDDLGRRFERILLHAALRHTRGHKQEAARRIGWGRNTLTRKLRELGVEP